ncbi:MAG: carbohydrate kinase [Chitinivibrionales bacterium]|nr:carbohydrate kinase [Chitinivibrionales bacterium]MBD3395389.1 carbohydrate kinase [Chitinivibrionales bacterium]
MSDSGYLLGFDSGTSSIKATLLDAATGQAVASATSPKKEMEIIARQPGWAEQDPSVWWENAKNAVREIREKAGVDLKDVVAVGISYQMHGLVCVDKNNRVLRPSIIWCDSRAVPYGQNACNALGADKCLGSLLNSPGNFTAAKLAWVKENEPDIFAKIHKIMLPGDYLAMMLGGGLTTTPSGLSEGIMWDFTQHDLAGFLLDHLGFSHDIIPEIVPTFAVQGEVGGDVAAELGLKTGTPISYRGGDQPNNALSLNVLEPGEIAATAGTSGVVYGVTDSPEYDKQSRVNTFVHVNYSKDNPRYGVLLCVNGTGILNSWLKHNVVTVGDHGLDYPEMDALSQEAPVGCDGLSILPYGNGAERTLGNRNIGASMHGLNLNLHGKKHILRAAQEGIVFALNYGLGIMKGMGVDVRAVRAGDANMFRSPLFQSAFATVAGARLELYNTDGSRGAARGAGIGAGIYKNMRDAFVGLTATKTIDPDKQNAAAYDEAYQRWLGALETRLR